MGLYFREPWLCNCIADRSFSVVRERPTESEAGEKSAGSKFLTLSSISRLGRSIASFPSIAHFSFMIAFFQTIVKSAGWRIRPQQQQSAQATLALNNVLRRRTLRRQFHSRARMWAEEMGVARELPSTDSQAQRSNPPVRGGEHACCFQYLALTKCPRP